MPTALLPLLWRSSGPHQSGLMGETPKELGWVSAGSLSTKPPAFWGDCGVTQRAGSVVFTASVPLSARRTVAEAFRMAPKRAGGYVDSGQMSGQSKPPT